MIQDASEPPPRSAFHARAERFVDEAEAMRGTLTRVSRMVSWVTVFIVVFTFLAWLGTLRGLLEILAAGDNSGGILGAAMVFILVTAQTGMMLYLLSQAASADNSWQRRWANFLFYLPFLFFSFTFGFAFYWTQLEAKNQAIGDALTALEAFDSRLAIANSNIGVTVSTLSGFRDDFSRRADLEASEGSQCGEASGHLVGPRARHLRQRADTVGAFVSRITPRIESVSQTATRVRTEVDAVRRMGRQTSSQTSPVGREQLFQETAADGAAAAITISAIGRDGDVIQQAQNFRTWASEYRNPSLVRTEEGTGLTFRCYNPAAADALDAAAAQLTSLPQLEPPVLQTFTGPAATQEAVNRMLYSFTHIFDWRSIPPTTRDEQLIAAERAGVNRAMRANQRAEEIALAPPSPGIRSNDIFSLFIAAFVDVSLAFAAFSDKPAERFSGLTRAVAEARRPKVNPIRVVRNAKRLRDNEDWQFIVPYMFERHGDDFLAQPLNRATPEGLMFQQIVTGFKLAKLIKRSHMSQEEIRELLEAVDSPVAEDVGIQRYQAWRFTKNNMDWMLMAAMFEDDDEPSPEYDEGKT